MAATRFYVYIGVNHMLMEMMEIYFGVSKNPKHRIDGSHCEQGTVALKHWKCDADEITWEMIGSYDNQPSASAIAHDLEKQRPPKSLKDYEIIQTAGI